MISAVSSAPTTSRTLPQDGPLYGISEAARLLGINRVTLWRWIGAGRLPVYRLGPRTARIRHQDLQRLLVRTGRPTTHVRTSTTRDGQPAGDHFVQFYESDDFLAQTVADFFAEGISAGEAAIVIATDVHRAAIDARLRAAGLDVDEAARTGQYIRLDAAATLDRFMRRGALDPIRFAEVIGGVISQAAVPGGRPVRTFGEMVALLALEGQTAAALQLERLWNDLQHTHSFSLLCAYPMHRLGGPHFATLIADVCAVHSRTMPTEAYTTLTDEDDRIRLVAQLQQRAATLATEVAQRERAERLLRDFLETAAVGMHSVGPDGTIVWANRAELDLLGYAHDEYVGHHIADFYVDRAVIDDILARLASGERLCDQPARLRHKDGSHRDVLLDSSVLWEDGRYIHTRCFTRDVTEVRRLEREHIDLLERERAARAAAEQAAARSRRLQEIASQLSHSLEPAQVLATIARAAADLLDAPVGAVFLLDRDAQNEGFSLAAAHGIDLSRTPELRLPRHASLAGRAIDEGRTLVVDDVREAPGATALPALLTGETAGSEIAAPITAGADRLGVVKAFSPTVRRFTTDDADLLDALAAAAAVALTNAQLYRQAQDALRARDEFLSSAAHDLKTPLTAIKGVAQFLGRQAAQSGTLDPSRLREGLLSVDASATRLARQIDQLLDITRLRAGLSLALQRRPTDLTALVEKAAAEHRQASAPHTILVESDGLPLVGEWDRARLERVLDNLIGNALKYSPHGGDVVISVARRDGDGAGDGDGPVAELTVRDHGIGIPTADLPHVFDRFHRASNVPENVVGTGIGLASVRQVVEQHGGTVSVDSREGRGSAFTVRLPLVASDPAAEVAA